MSDSVCSQKGAGVSRPSPVARYLRRWPPSPARSQPSRQDQTLSDEPEVHRSLPKLRHLPSERPHARRACPANHVAAAGPPLDTQQRSEKKLELPRVLWLGSTWRKTYGDDRAWASSIRTPGYEARECAPSGPRSAASSNIDSGAGCFGWLTPGVVLRANHNKAPASEASRRLRQNARQHQRLVRSHALQSVGGSSNTKLGSMECAGALPPRTL